MSLGIKMNEWQKREYRQKGYWGDATLQIIGTCLLKCIRKDGSCDLQKDRYTYAELDKRLAKVAAFLKEAGVEPGDFVSLQLPGWSEFTVIYVACLKVGAVVNPICQTFVKRN